MDRMSALARLCYVLRMTQERKPGAVRRSGSAARQAKLLARRRALRVEIDGRLVAPLPEDQHGTIDARINHDCQCLRCVEAGTRARWPGSRERVSLTTAERAQLRAAQVAFDEAKGPRGADRRAAMDRAARARNALVCALDRKYEHGYGLVKQLAEALGLSRYAVDKIIKVERAGSEA